METGTVVQHNDAVSKLAVMFVLDPVHPLRSIRMYCPSNVLFTLLRYPNDLLTQLPAMLYACLSVCIISQMCACGI